MVIFFLAGRKHVYTKINPKIHPQRQPDQSYQVNGDIVPDMEQKGQQRVRLDLFDGK